MKKFHLTLGLCLFVGFAAFAQSEKERNFPESQRSNELSSHYENHESPIVDSKSENNSKLGVSSTKDQKANSAQTTKKDNPLFKQGGEKDAKKEEISTLSFNLFLYIVDRFKED